MLNLLLGIVFITVVVITFIILLSSKQLKSPFQKRLHELSIPEEKEKLKSHFTKKEKQKLSETGKKVLSQLGNITQLKPEKKSKLHERLSLAGYRREENIKLFVGIQAAGAIIGAGLTFYLGWIGQNPLGTVIFLSIMATVAGYKIPDAILNNKIRKRQQQIGEELPDALDLLVITVEAGLGLNAAILKVGQDLKMRSPFIAEEFSKVNQDLRTGISREEALRDLGKRNKVEDLKIFVGALILADRLGTSIADTLRIQADSLRTRIRQKAQERAAKSAIKMLIPLVLFILPALIMVLMGPGIISVIRTFSK